MWCITLKNKLNHGLKVGSLSPATMCYLAYPCKFQGLRTQKDVKTVKNFCSYSAFGTKRKRNTFKRVGEVFKR